MLMFTANCRLSRTVALPWARSSPCKAAVWYLYGVAPLPAHRAEDTTGRRLESLPAPLFGPSLVGTEENLVKIAL